MNTLPLDRVIKADWLDYVKELPPASVDLIVTDPAYPSLMKWVGIGTTAQMGMGRKGSGADALEDKFYPVMDTRDLPDLTQECYRVLKPGGHCYINCNEDTDRDLWRYAVEEGVWPLYKSQGVMLPPYQLLVWEKHNSGMGYPFLRCHEFVAFMFKGLVFDRDGVATKRRLINAKGIRNVLHYKELRGNAALFPTQKPDAMMEDFIKWSSQPGDTVLDLFCGSGTTARAARKLGRHYLTCDVWDKAVAVARSRIAEVEFGEGLEHFPVPAKIIAFEQGELFAEVVS